MAKAVNGIGVVVKHGRVLSRDDGARGHSIVVRVMRGHQFLRIVCKKHAVVFFPQSGAVEKS